jgi:uncharacterized protein
MLGVQISKGVNARFKFVEAAESFFGGDFFNEENFVGDVEVVGEVEDDGLTLKIVGKIYCRRKFICDRCLIQAEENQVHEFEEEIDESEIVDGILDITELVRDTLIAAQPIKNLCKPNCKGLCPKCGQNLNQGECNCDNSTIDPRLAALLDFKTI